jgi:hypothetical protein
MRRKAGQATFKPIAAAVTDSDGDFSLKLRARRTSRYVASVALQPPCAASTSDSEKVRVKKR